MTVLGNTVSNEEVISLLVCQGQLDSTLVMRLKLDKLLGEGESEAVSESAG